MPRQICALFRKINYTFLLSGLIVIDELTPTFKAVEYLESRVFKEVWAF